MTTQIPLWAVLFGVGLGTSLTYAWGRYNGRRALRWQYEQGYNAGHHDRMESIERRLRNGWRLVMNPRTDQPVWRGHYEGTAWPPDIGEGDDTDTITAVLPPSQPDDASYRRQLVAIGQPFAPHAGRPPWHGPRHAAPAAELEAPAAELEGQLSPERFWMVVLSIVGGSVIADRYAPQGELEGLADGVSYAALPAPVPDAQAELEAEIDAYLANRANSDTWRSQVEAEHRAFCSANGLPWQPIDWEG